jgi:AbrB family looped-hinge helix DNA binding protein
MESYYGTVTQKGQVTIPLAYRQAFNIKPLSKVKFSVNKSKLTIEASQHPSIFDLAGKIKPNKNKPLMTFRDEMERNYTRV